MRKQFHILNGDSLKEILPANIQGEMIVARECLIDGNVEGKSLDDFFATRAKFISDNYEGSSKQDYYNKTVIEFQKIQAIPQESEINLWFEDDLFCQVNFWFVISLLAKSHKGNRIFLVRPITNSQYGFGGLNESELRSIYTNRLLLTNLDKLAKLWVLYQNDDTEKLLETARDLENKYPFILPAVKAHLERIPIERNPGRPSRSLLQIMNELKTEEFEPIFKEFCNRESIYGFGDLQVKRLLDDIKSNRE